MQVLKQIRAVPSHKKDDTLLYVAYFTQSICIQQSCLYGRVFQSGVIQGASDETFPTREPQQMGKYTFELPGGFASKRRRICCLPWMGETESHARSRTPSSKAHQGLLVIPKKERWHAMKRITLAR